jgi:hypothetical protein
MMRVVQVTVAVVLAVLSASALADETFPDLTGTWERQSDAVGHKNALGEGEAATRFVGHVEAALVIDWQDGARFTGREMDEKGTEDYGALSGEQYSGVIGFDNVSVYMVDENGFTDCRLVSADVMECIYRHITPEASIAGRLTLTRQE